MTGRSRFRKKSIRPKHVMKVLSKKDADAVQSPGFWIAVAACALFLASLWGAWTVSRQTEYPPIHDVLSYTTKAENVWKQLRQGRFTDLLAVEQTIRPFGTALMGYPLGYNEDYRAFYWRTVAIPACLFALAALVAALAAGSSWKEPSAWLLACLGGMLPMWWAFDPVHSGKGITSWGMMDGMQSAIAALATALLLFGWRRNTVAPTFAAFLLSAFTLLLKPVGVFLIAGQTLAAFGLWIWSFRRQDSSRWLRFAWGASLGIVWCAGIAAWCYFSPYFSEANKEMGRQALDQLKLLAKAGFVDGFLLGVAPKLCTAGVGVASISLWIVCAIRYRKTQRQHQWLIVLPFVAALVLALLLAALYAGTHFLMARYFLPALAVMWIFSAPLLWFLLHDSRYARLVVLVNAVILAASVWFPQIARRSHVLTGYATFTNEVAGVMGALARESVEASRPFATEPVIYILPGATKFNSFMVAHQLVATGRWKENVLWKYKPRVWEKHWPVIHPHEVAAADFVVAGPLDPGRLDYKPVPTAEDSALEFLNSPVGDSLAPALARARGITVRKIIDPIGLERELVARLAGMHALQPEESGPLPANSDEAPLAIFTSGDDLLAAKAEWAAGKLRITTTWSGSRAQKEHLAMNFALLDAQGTPLHWIVGSLLPPPCGQDGKQYRRTIVDDLDCGKFSSKTTSAAIRVFDRSRKQSVATRAAGSSTAEQMISLPIGGSGEQQP